MAIKISTGLPNCREGRQNLIGSVSIQGMQQTARLAEELGYYSLWPNEFIATDAAVSNRYAEPPNLYDTIVTMAYVAAATDRIRITPSTIVLPLHEPLLLARQIATLDVFSGGRITLGIGLGGPAEEYRRFYGLLEKPNRGQMMDDYLQALRALWSDRAASFHGRYVSISDVEAFPKPAQSPLPIFIAGKGEAMLHRLAKFGQGWIDFAMPPDEMHATAELIQRYAEEAGRDDVRFEIARQFYVSIAPTEAEAVANRSAAVPPATKERPSPATATPGSSSEPTLVGTPEQIRARLQEYVTAGATELCVIFYAPDLEATERQLRLFATEVMPGLDPAM
jgi:probable F420-dependent oxidoreductase